MVRILWTYDDFNGPRSGLALYDGVKVWFAQIEEPKVVSNTNIKVPSKDESSKKLATQQTFFVLKKLDEEMLKKIEDDHLEYCKATGAPVHHGDPYISNRIKMANPTNTPAGATPNIRCLSDSKSYVHKFKPIEITGDVIAVVKEEDFDNFHVAKQIIH